MLKNQNYMLAFWGASKALTTSKYDNSVKRLRYPAISNFNRAVSNSNWTVTMAYLLWYRSHKERNVK